MQISNKISYSFIISCPLVLASLRNIILQIPYFCLQDSMHFCFLKGNVSGQIYHALCFLCIVLHIFPISFVLLLLLIIFLCKICDTIFIHTLSFFLVICFFVDYFHVLLCSRRLCCIFMARDVWELSSSYLDFFNNNNFFCL